MGESNNRREKTNKNIDKRGKKKKEKIKIHEVNGKEKQKRGKRGKEQEERKIGEKYGEKLKKRSF